MASINAGFGHVKCAYSSSTRLGDTSHSLVAVQLVRSTVRLSLGDRVWQHEQVQTALPAGLLELGREPDRQSICRRAPEGHAVQKRLRELIRGLSAGARVGLDHVPA